MRILIDKVLTHFYML